VDRILTGKELWDLTEELVCWLVLSGWLLLFNNGGGGGVFKEVTVNCFALNLELDGGSR
jgi:hypothetical protein